VGWTRGRLPCRELLRLTSMGPGNAKSCEPEGPQDLTSLTEAAPRQAEPTSEFVRCADGAPLRRHRRWHCPARRGRRGVDGRAVAAGERCAVSGRSTRPTRASCTRVSAKAVFAAASTAGTSPPAPAQGTSWSGSDGLEPATSGVTGQATRFHRRIRTAQPPPLSRHRSSRRPRQARARPPSAWRYGRSERPSCRRFASMNQWTLRHCWPRRP